MDEDVATGTSTFRMLADETWSTGTVLGTPHHHAQLLQLRLTATEYGCGPIFLSVLESLLLLCLLPIDTIYLLLAS